MMTNKHTMESSYMNSKAICHEEVDFQKELQPSKIIMIDKILENGGEKIKRNKKCLTKCSSMQTMMRKQELLSLIKKAKFKNLI
ncbi:MAG: hypothetical protein P8K09_01870 [Hyphomicrobiales bacterium]|nr:hypothetical protein [Hyphomicrobiales bacterium]